MTTKNFDAAIVKAAETLGYTLKPEQLRTLQKFVAGQDVFVSLPTGYGKSLCYILLPKIFDLIKDIEDKSIVIVVSPLVALMKNQVESINKIGLPATYVSDTDSSSTVEQDVRNGKFRIVFMSPEALFLSAKWKSMLSSDLYRENLVGFIVDEAHCVKKWGEKFRREFSHLGEIRSIIPGSVRVMALTATDTKTTRKFIINSLNMQSPDIVYVPPLKDNIVYNVLDKPRDIGDYFGQLVEKLKVERTNMHRIIIFCKTYNNIISIYQYFKCTLGKDFVEPPGSSDFVVNRLVDIYTHCTHESVKNKIVLQFTQPSSLRIVIATIAFGMGIDCSDVRHIIHWGVPADAEMYVQECGRAGRDGELSCATIFKNSADLNKQCVTQHMVDYCNNMSTCRRKILFEDFPGCHFTFKGCKCCDICLMSCKCGQCANNLKLFHY